MAAGAFSSSRSPGSGEGGPGHQGLAALAPHVGPGVTCIAASSRAACAAVATVVRTRAADDAEHMGHSRTSATWEADMPEYSKSPKRVSELTDEQYRVTQQDATEPSFVNAY